VGDDWSTEEELHLAARDGDLTRARMILAGGADPNGFDDLSYTPLHYAVKHDHLDMVSLLLTYGADVNAHDESHIGNTPIREFASNCSLAMAKLLLDAGADPTIQGWMQLNALDVAKGRKRGDGPKVYELLVRHAGKHA
jgi:ankyrin repeat protein